MCGETRNSNPSKSILEAVMCILNVTVEAYLSHVIKPFLTLHEKFYLSLNRSIRNCLDENTDKVPNWFTANFITYVRTIAVVPTVMLLVNGYKYLPALLILTVDFGDFLDGVVARYWSDRKKIESISIEEEAKDKPKMSASWIIDHRQKSYGGFIDAVCDKAFVVPIWMLSLSSVPSSTFLRVPQYIVLWFLIFTEVSSGCIRFRAYYTCNGVTAPSVKGLDFSTSAVKADHIGKAKQTFEMFGTAFFVSSNMKYIGLILLAAAVPLAYESVRRKTKKRVIYVDATNDNIDHHTLKFWKQAKGLGSKLVVGLSEEKKDMIEFAKACESVDCVLLDAVQGKLTSNYLDQIDIDYVVCGVGQSVAVVSTELIAAKRCLIIIDDNTAKPLESKDVKTE